VTFGDNRIDLKEHAYICRFEYRRYEMIRANFLFLLIFLSDNSFLLFSSLNDVAQQL